MTIVIGSYQAVEHPGTGHRASSAALWRGEDLRTLNDVAMTILPIDDADNVRLAVDAVSSIRHPHLLPVIDVVQDTDRVAVVCPWPAGGRLAELILRRGRLSPSETLTVLLPVAAALVSMHEAGIGHGGVCPEAVWFDAHGRPLLGAPAVSRIVANVNGGLPAGIRDVAPEVVRDERVAGHDGTGDVPDSGWPDSGSTGGGSAGGGSAVGGWGPSFSPAADVFSLGSVAMFCLTGRSAWAADEPADVLVQSAIGQWPDPPDDAGPIELVELVREMLRLEPSKRPRAADLAERLTRFGDPAPILFSAEPTPTPASANRWRGWSTPPGATPAAEHASPSPAAGGRHGRRSQRGDSSERGDPSRRSDAAEPGRPSDRSDTSTLSDASARVERPDTEMADFAEVEDDLAAGTTSEPVDPGRSGAARRHSTPLSRAGLALLGGLLVTVIAVQVGAWWSGRDQPGSPSVDAVAAADAVVAGDAPDAVVAADSGDEVVPGTAEESAASWSDVVIGLDAARSRALDAADPAMLADVYLDSNSAAGAADVAVITQLADQGLRVVDGVHQIVSVSLVDPRPAGSGQADPPPGNDVRLAVVDTLPSHPVVDAAGRQVGVTVSRAEQRQILVLSPTPSGYRISSIEAG